MNNNPCNGSVLESARAVAGVSRHVTISDEGITTAAMRMYEERGGVLSEPEGQPSLLEPRGLSNDDDILKWIFLLDTLNFCFWSEESTLFTVKYHNRLWTGYRALEAALCRAIDSGTPIHRPSYYSRITLGELEEIFQSETHVSIPLLELRLNCLHEAASVLNMQYEGRVSKLIESCGKDAVRLSHQLATSFTSYRDISTYHQMTVPLLKRAQIFPSDLWNRFGGMGYGEFTNIGDLTMFADYRVPQSLQYFGVLNYSDELFSVLRSGVELAQGCVKEVEIRACSIWAVELIRRKIEELRKSSEGGGGEADNGPVLSVAIDYWLWNFAKTNSHILTLFPIHHTSSVFY